MKKQSKKSWYLIISNHGNHTGNNRKWYISLPMTYNEARKEKKETKQEIGSDALHGLLTVGLAKKDDLFSFLDEKNKLFGDGSFEIIEEYNALNDRF